MARPIEETPLLKGKDAERFSEAILKNESKKASVSECKKVMHNYDKIKKLAKFE